MTTTINISLPNKMYKKAKKLVAEGKYHSVSELIRAGLRRTFYDADKITENGLPGWSEDRILEAADQPVRKNDEVWETPEDIDKYFEKFRKKIANKKHGKDKANWHIQSVSR